MLGNEAQLVTDSRQVTSNGGFLTDSDQINESMKEWYRPMSQSSQET